MDDSSLDTMETGDGPVKEGRGSISPAKREGGLSAITVLAIGVNESSPLGSVVSIFAYGLATGGPAAMVWGWLLGFIMTMVVAWNFAEMCAALPLAGSLYQWSGAFAPKHMGPRAAFWTGVFNFVGNVAMDATFAYTFAVLINSSCSLSGLPSTLSASAILLVAIAVSSVWAVMICYHIDCIGWINDFACILQLVSVFVIFAVTLHMAPSYNSPHDVFFSVENFTGFTDITYVIVISSLFSTFGFAGYEASATMAEETDNSSSSAPRAVLLTCLITGVWGMIFICVLLSVMQGTDDAINGSLGNAALQIILQSTNTPFTAVSAWMLALNMFFAGLSSSTVTSRVGYALFRDGSSPQSRFMAKKHPKLNTPVNVALFTLSLQALLLLLPLASADGAGFQALTSLTAVGLQVSYALPIVMKCVALATDCDTFQEDAIVTLKQAPQYLGRLSLPLGILACTWLTITSIVSLFPTTYPITVGNMNYSGLTLAAILVIGEIVWQFEASRSFKKGSTERDKIKRGRFSPGISCNSSGAGTDCTSSFSASSPSSAFSATTPSTPPSEKLLLGIRKFGRSGSSALTEVSLSYSSRSVPGSGTCSNREEDGLQPEAILNLPHGGGGGGGGGVSVAEGGFSDLSLHVVTSKFALITEASNKSSEEGGEGEEDCDTAEVDDILCQTEGQIESPEDDTPA